MDHQTSYIILQMFGFLKLQSGLQHVKKQLQHGHMVLAVYSPSVQPPVASMNFDRYSILVCDLSEIMTWMFRNLLTRIQRRIVYPK